MSDEDLVRMLRSGRTPARCVCAHVIDAHGDALYLHCAELLGDPDLVAVVLRDTLIVACAHVHRLPRAGELRAWLLAIAAAECARHGTDADTGTDTVPDEPGAPRATPCGSAVGPLDAAVWPAALRLRVLSGIGAPELDGYRAHVAARGGRFGRDGFPVPVAPAGPPRPLSYLLPGLLIGLVALLTIVFVLIELAGIGPGLLSGDRGSAPLG